MQKKWFHVSFHNKFLHDSNIHISTTVESAKTPQIAGRWITRVTKANCLQYMKQSNITGRWWCQVSRDFRVKLPNNFLNTLLESSWAMTLLFSDYNLIWYWPQKFSKFCIVLLNNVFISNFSTPTYHTKHFNLQVTCYPNSTVFHKL